MGRPIKLKGKTCDVLELKDKTFSRVFYEIDRGCHVVTFFGEEIYKMWGQSCCCDVAAIDYIDGPLSRMAGQKIIKAQRSGNESEVFNFTTEDGYNYRIKWKSKHPRFTEQGVLISRLK